MIRINAPRPFIKANYYLHYSGSRVNYIHQNPRFVSLNFHRYSYPSSNTEDILILDVTLFDDETYSIGIISGIVYEHFKWLEKPTAIGTAYFFSRNIILSSNISYIEGEIYHQIELNGENINDKYEIKIFIEDPSWFNKILRESDCHYLDFE